MQSDTFINNWIDINQALNQVFTVQRDEENDHSSTEQNVYGEGNGTPELYENPQNTQENKGVIIQQDGNEILTENVAPVQPNKDGTRDKRKRQDFMGNEAYYELKDSLPTIFVHNQPISSVVLDKRLRRRVYQMNRIQFKKQFKVLKEVYRKHPNVSLEYLLDVLNCSHNRDDYDFELSRAAYDDEWKGFEINLINVLRMLIKKRKDYLKEQYKKPNKGNHDF